MDKLFILTTGSTRKRIMAVTHSDMYSQRLRRRAKTTPSVVTFDTVLPRFHNGKIKPTFKVWVTVDDSGYPVRVKFTKPETTDNIRVFDSTLQHDYVNVAYDVWHLYLDCDNPEEREVLIDRGANERKETTARMNDNPHSGSLVYVTRRRRYSRSYPHRLEINVSRNIGTHRSREEIAREIDEYTQNGKLDVFSMEFNVDYTLKPQSWSIPTELMVRDEEVSIN